MRAGFPDQFDINDFLIIFKARIDNFEQYSNNLKDLCSQLVRSCGLKWKDFKLGNTKIFFRNSKLKVLADKLNGDVQIIIDCFKKKKNCTNEMAHCNNYHSFMFDSENSANAR